jgi:1-acyl-sn-glycerol-3-phosphate acyltransferase
MDCARKAFTGDDAAMAEDFRRAPALGGKDAAGAARRAVRTGLRLARVALHLLRGTATVAFIYPRASPAHRLALRRRWSHRLLALLGVELRLSGATAEGLVVANHISFLDIYLLNAAAPADFVAKADVSGWPLIGWLAARTDTIFIERGSRAAAQRARAALVQRLHAGRRAVVFAEGTTTRGDTVLPFHTALLQAAIDADVPVTPVALRYLARDGSRSEAPAYVDAVTLWQCLRAIAAADGLVAALEVLPPIPAHGADRRHLAARAHRAIARSLGVAHQT